ncbi:MAG: cation:proton antiporter [Saprospiraceae bacterium]|nr:cation:proton antiporter [Saprospiraceae bacterium]
MDSNYILLAFGVVILLSYSFDHIGKRLNLPSVVLLLGAGMLVQPLLEHYSLQIPYIEIILPTIGTLALLLIVLEGSLELTISEQNKGVIFKTFLSSAIGVLLGSIAIGGLLIYLFDLPLKIAFVNAIPLSVISSAVAIPSVVHLRKADKDYVIYESTYSDILGILLFNYVVFAETFTIKSAFTFSFSFLFIIVISIVCSLLLVFYLNNIKHHVRFLPIFAVILIAYAIAKSFHQSPLIIIMIFGLTMNNTHLFIKGFLENKFNTESLRLDLINFKMIGAEMVFILRTLFFLLFGFSIDLKLLLGWNNILLAIYVFIIIIILRVLTLSFIARSQLKTLLFFAPRGLITILLFLSIPPEYESPIVSEGVVTIIVLLTVFFMIFGSRFSSKT